MIDIDSQGKIYTLDRKEKVPDELNDFIATFVRNGRKIVYTSKKPALILAELVIDSGKTADSDAIDVSCSLIIYRYENDLFYAGAISNGFVNEHFVGSLEKIKEKFGFWLKLKDIKVYSNTELNLNTDVIRIGDIKLTDEVVNKYMTSDKLAKRKEKQKKAIKWLAIVITAFVGINYLWSNYDTEVETVVIDPMQSYKDDIRTQVSLSDALTETAKLMAYSSTFPEGVISNDLSKVGNNLEMKYQRKDVLQSVFMSWIESNPQFKSLMGKQKFVVPLGDFPNRWLKTISTIEDTYPDYLHDLILAVGGKHVTLDDWVDVRGEYSQRSITFNLDNAEIGILTYLARKVRNQPVFLTSLSITPSEIKKAQIQAATFTVTVKGKRYVK